MQALQQEAQDLWDSRLKMNYDVSNCSNKRVLDVVTGHTIVGMVSRTNIIKKDIFGTREHVGALSVFL